MSSEESSTDYSYCSNTDNNSTSSEDSAHGCYYNEPEYTHQELKNRKQTEEGYGSVDEHNSSRLENLHWCSCRKCVIFQSMSLHECKCCREYSNLLGSKLEGKECVTLNEEFEILCLNRVVLETAYIRYRRNKNKFKNLSTLTNK